MQTAQPEVLDSLWPDHGEDLSGVIYAQSLLQHFGNELAITPAIPAPEVINPIFSSHPLNASHHELSSEECERLWNGFISEKPDTIMLNDIKAEALRQVRIFIRKGLDTLRKSQASQSIKRSRSGSLGPEEDVNVGVKKRKINDSDDQHVDVSKEKPEESGTAADDLSQETAPADGNGPETGPDPGPAGSETGAPAAAGLEAGPEAGTEADSEPQTTRKDSSVPPESPQAAPAQEDQPDKDQSSQPSGHKQDADHDREINESDSSVNAEPEVPDSEAAEGALPTNNDRPDESKSDDDVESAHADADAESRNDSEDSRQSSVAPEAMQRDESAADTTDTKKSPDIPKLDLPQESPNDAEQPKIRRRSRASRASRSARTTPQSSRAASVEPSASASPASEASLSLKDADEPKEQSQLRSRKRRGSTASASDASVFDGTLTSLISTLSSAPILEPFQKPFSKRSRIVLSPTDLSLIHTQVENQELETIDDVEQELAKMLANAVMGFRMDISDAASFIWKEVADFRRDSVDADNSQGPTNKRRRRE